MHSKFKLITDATTSARMKRIRQRNTKPELLLRRWLWHRGIRFTTSNRDLPGSPDVANRGRAWAIFVHGCFWHGHRGCARSRLPKRNVLFWKDKIKRNRRRDQRKENELIALGFRVLTVWECEVARLETNPNRRAENLLTFFALPVVADRPRHLRR
jgi:DNA mismatch endonuclease, patch repair protein